MKVLIVDNGTHFKNKLTNLLAGHEITRIDHRDADPKKHGTGFDLIILSGAYATHSVKYYGDKLFAEELELIRNTETPIIGLCFGAQLVARLYGARLSFVQGGKSIRGPKRVWNIKQTPFDFFPYYGAKVWASQRWRITELPGSMEAWCASAHGVEVFKHRKKHIYGIQFHPEYYTQDNDGRRIFNKIIELIQS